MPDWSLIGNGTQVENWNGQSSSSRGGTITANASANTKATGWNALTASAGFDVTTLLIMLDDLAAGIDYLIDIAVGANGSEVVIVDNLLATGGTGSISYGMTYCLHVHIPAGTRVTARCQASTGSSVIRISALAFGNHFLGSAPRGKVTTYGANTGDSGGTSIDPGGTINTKPSTFTEITSSTTYPITELILAFGNQLNTTRSSFSWLVDLAIGASSSEQIILPDMALNCSTSPDIVVPQFYGPLPVDIPAGTRLSARAQCSGNDATDRLFDLVLYGVS